MCFPEAFGFLQWTSIANDGKGVHGSSFDDPARVCESLERSHLVLVSGRPIREPRANVVLERVPRRPRDRRAIQRPQQGAPAQRPPSIHHPSYRRDYSCVGEALELEPDHSTTAFGMTGQRTKSEPV